MVGIWPFVDVKPVQLICHSGDRTTVPQSSNRVEKLWGCTTISFSQPSYYSGRNLPFLAILAVLLLPNTTNLIPQPILPELMNPIQYLEKVDTQGISSQILQGPPEDGLAGISRSSDCEGTENSVLKMGQYASTWEGSFGSMHLPAIFKFAKPSLLARTLLS